MDLNTREQKKREKFQSLVRAAYDLFLEQGFAKTSIDEIVNRANVAKGTFYLYFKDKGDVMQNVSFILCCKVLEDGCTKTADQRTGDFVEDYILVMDYLLDYLANNKLVLQLIGKNFSWPDSPDSMREEDMPNLYKYLKESSERDVFAHRTEKETYILLFTLTQLCTSLCHSSVLHGQPTPLDELKPFLFNMIRQLLGQHIE
ncbi:MAG: TetR/AcrR family transcriptional regulator [Oscillospiraceae bacterium]